SRNGASGTSDMNGCAAREAARESGDERVQSIVVSEIVRDVSAPLDMTRKKAYARAGVDVDLGNKLKRRIQSLVRQTHGAHVLGARPLFFLDYIGCEKLEPRVFDQLIRGFSGACRRAGCALIGGETAQLPGIYRKGEYDLAGCIVGVVDRKEIIDGSKIKPGDVVLGLGSNGLHTNGYSLARKIFIEQMRLNPKAVGKELL